MMTCLLCGATSHDVAMGLVEWLTPVGRDRYSSIPRCKNRRACRARVEEEGGEYEVRDPFEAAPVIPSRR